MLLSRWSGSAWSPVASINRWTGSAWGAVSFARRWDGSSWIDLLLKAVINGAGSVSDTPVTHVFNLSVTATGDTPTGYSWSITNGSLSSTTSAVPNLTLSRNTSATVTCTVTFSGGGTATAYADCTYSYSG